MDPPAMMNGEVYTLPEIWQFPVNGVGGRGGFGMGMGLGRFGDQNRVGGLGSDDFEHRSRKRKGLELEEEEEEDDPFKGGVSSSNGHGNALSDGNNGDAKQNKANGNLMGDECPNGGAGAAEPEPSSGKNVERKATGAPQPPKQDYIHVRARRGQATDSHSLAERARREKISERMKILQDLVPGCNKVIGKALVLDEIINYIQSLQRQVEFLSMKLEAVNTRMNPEIEVFPSKDFGHQTFDPASMAFATQAAREFSRGPSPEWLHMQVGGGFERTS